MQESEVTLSVAGVKSAVFQDASFYGRHWLSVGSSALCDLYCSSLRPNQNTQVSFFRGFFSLKRTRDVSYGFQFVVSEQGRFSRKKIRFDCSFVDVYSPDTEESFLAYQRHFASAHYRLLKEELPRFADLTSSLSGNPAQAYRTLSEALVEFLNQTSCIPPMEARVIFELSLALFCDFRLQSGMTHYLTDQELNEIVVNGDGCIWVERCGSWEKGDFLFFDWNDFLQWLAFQCGKAGSELYTPRSLSQFVLPCGARVHVTFPPVSRSEGYVSIRCHRMRNSSLTDLHAGEFFDEKALELLTRAVQLRWNILVVGSTSSGKTTLLSALLNEVSASERLVVLEDTPEISLVGRHALYLQTKSALQAHQTEITLDDLVKEALRMRPDRLVVGECRGVEAYSLLQALHTGHSGTLCTLHGRSASEALDRFECLVLQAQPSLTSEVVRRMILTSLDCVIVLGRTASGKRVANEIVCIQEGRIGLEWQSMAFRQLLEPHNES